MKESFKHDTLEDDAVSLEENDERGAVYLKQVLESIDEGKLIEFLRRELKKGGLDDNEFDERFVLIKDIKLQLSREVSSLAEAGQKNIDFFPIVNHESFKRITRRFLEERVTDNNKSYEETYFDVAKIAALNTLIHEELHVLSERDLSFVAGNIGSVESRIWDYMTGVNRNISHEMFQTNAITNLPNLVDLERVDLFRGLNEGLTELFAQQLTREYLRQNPEIDNVELTQYFIDSSVEWGAYYKERWVVEQLAAVFSELLEVPEEIVIKSFFVEYLENRSLLPPEFGKVIQEYLPEISPEMIEEFLTAIKGSLVDKSFNEDSAINQCMYEIIEILPKEKAHRCKDKLAALQEKYNQSNSLDEGLLSRELKQP